MGRLSNFFSRRKQSSARNDSAETWRTGDLAECTVAGPWYLNGCYPRSGPALGERRVVAGVELHRHLATGERVQFLRFTRYGCAVFLASGFRKVVPVADQQVAADPAFLDKLIGQPAELEPAGETSR